jgi:hypothetical protein
MAKEAGRVTAPSGLLTDNSSRPAPEEDGIATKGPFKWMKSEEYDSASQRKKKNGRNL